MIALKSTDKVAVERIAVYVRVSSRDQNPEGQIRDIRQWFRAQNLDPDLACWYVDKETGNRMQRQCMDQLQASIAAKAVDAVVVWKLDRISRKLLEGLTTLVEWCRQEIRVVSVTQELDFNGTIGQLIASVLFAVAEMEQELRKERQAAGIAAAKERGVYKRISEQKKNWTNRKKRYKMPPAKIWQYRKRGMGYKQIAQKVGLSHNTVRSYCEIMQKRQRQEDTFILPAGAVEVLSDHGSTINQGSPDL